MERIIGCRGSLQGASPWIPQESLILRSRAAKLRTRSAPETPPSDRQANDAVEDALKQAAQLLDAIQSQAGATAISTGRLPTAGTLSSARNPEQSPDVILQCDVSGCTIMPVLDADESPTAVSGTLLDAFQTEKLEANVELLQGKGWKLGRDRRAASDGSLDSTHCAIIGGDDWSISLTADEYRDFVHLLQSLRSSPRRFSPPEGCLRQGVATLEVCGDWGGEGSEANLEMHTPRVWMQGRASQKRLTLLSRLWSRKSLDEADLPDVAFSLRFIISSEGSREVEGSWSADAVMQALKALDSQASLAQG